MIKRPYFIVGSERSGTTLLRLMLDYHPRLACLFEFDYSVDQVGADGSFPDLEDYRAWLPTRRSFYTSGASIDPSLNYRELVDSFLQQKRQRGGKEFIGGTVHRYFDRLLHIWPDAHFIHIIRDPRDVAPSCVAMGWAGNVWGAVERWLDAEYLWDDLVPRLDAGRYRELHYEDLIRDARKMLTKICEFLGVAFDEAMFSYPAKTTYDLPNPDRAQPWRENSSKRDVQLIEARVGDLLQRRGYERSDYPGIDLSPGEITSLEAHDIRGRRRLRVRRYGVPLFVAENITRRLPFEFLHSIFTKRMDAIDKRFIK